MPVFDFKNEPVDKKDAVCTYEAFDSVNDAPDAEHPLMVLDNSAREWKHHSTGFFTNPNKRTSFEFEEEGGLIGRIKKLMVEREDGEMPRKPAVDFIKLLIEKSYGVRPKDDPSLFLKEDDDGRPLFRKFKQTPAYDAYVYALLSGEESLEEFAANVLPQISDEQKAEAAKLLEAEGLGNVVRKV